MDIYIVKLAKIQYIQSATDTKPYIGLMRYFNTVKLRSIHFVYCKADLKINFANISNNCLTDFDITFRN